MKPENVAIVVEHDSKISKLQKKLKIAQSNGDLELESSICNHIGMRCEELEAWDRAAEFYLYDTQICETLEDPVGMCQAYQSLARVYEKIGAPSESYKVFKMAIKKLSRVNFPGRNLVQLTFLRSSLGRTKLRHIEELLIDTESNCYLTNVQISRLDAMHKHIVFETTIKELLNESFEAFDKAHKALEEYSSIACDEIIPSINSSDYLENIQNMKDCCAIDSLLLSFAMENFEISVAKADCLLTDIDGAGELEAEEKYLVLGVASKALIRLNEYQKAEEIYLVPRLKIAETEDKIEWKAETLADLAYARYMYGDYEFCLETLHLAASLVPDEIKIYERIKCMLRTTLKSEEHRKRLMGCSSVTQKPKKSRLFFELNMFEESAQCIETVEYPDLALRLRAAKSYVYLGDWSNAFRHASAYLKESNRLENIDDRQILYIYCDCIMKLSNKIVLSNDQLEFLIIRLEKIDDSIIGATQIELASVKCRLLLFIENDSKETHRRFFKTHLENQLIKMEAKGSALSEKLSIHDYFAGRKASKKAKNLVGGAPLTSRTSLSKKGAALKNARKSPSRPSSHRYASLNEDDFVVEMDENEFESSEPKGTRPSFKLKKVSRSSVKIINRPSSDDIFEEASKCTKQSDLDGSRLNNFKTNKKNDVQNSEIHEDYLITSNNFYKHGVNRPISSDKSFINGHHVNQSIGVHPDSSHSLKIRPSPMILTPIRVYAIVGNGGGEHVIIVIDQLTERPTMQWLQEEIARHASRPPVECDIPGLMEIPRIEGLYNKDFSDGSLNMIDRFKYFPNDAVCDALRDGDRVYAHVESWGVYGSFATIIDSISKTANNYIPNFTLLKESQKDLSVSVDFETDYKKILRALNLLEKHKKCTSLSFRCSAVPSFLPCLVLLTRLDLSNAMIIDDKSIFSYCDINENIYAKDECKIVVNTHDSKLKEFRGPQYPLFPVLESLILSFTTFVKSKSLESFLYRVCGGTLLEHSSLKELDLSGLEKIECVLDTILPLNFPMLEVLIMSCCSGIDCGALAALLKRTGKLFKLDMSYSSIESSTLSLFYEGFQSNASLQELDVCGLTGSLDLEHIREIDEKRLVSLTTLTF